MNLNKESQQDSVNLNVNTESDEATSHYSEIDKASPNWSTWPEDLRNSGSAQTYANVSLSGVPSSSSSSSFVSAPTPPPPPPPSVGPNASPSKPKSNCKLAQSMNELSLSSKSGAINVTKKLDPVFLAELEKHLGEKEASKNTNASEERRQDEASCASYARYSSLDKLRQGSPAQLSPVAAAEDTARSSSSSSVIPALKPPPQVSKPKSPVAMMDHRGASSSSSTLPGKVQNSWQPKSTNVQRPSVQQSDQRVESTTDAIVGQIWQQTQVLSQQNVRPTDLTGGRQTLTPVATAQANVNLLQEVAGDSTSNCANEVRHGPSNVAKVTFNQAQACSSNAPNYHSANLSSSSASQDAFSLLQIVTGNVSANSTNESQYGNAANVSKANFNQAQAYSSTSQNYLHNASTSIGSFNLLQTTANHVSAASLNESQYGPCNLSKASSSQAQACSSLSHNYLGNAPTTVNQAAGFTVHQNDFQIVAPMSSNVSSTHGITHIQNDLQQQQHAKSPGLLYEQVCAELKQTVRKILLHLPALIVGLFVFAALLN